MIMKDELTMTDIVFTGSDAVLPGSALNEHYITDFATLRSMGDKLISSLAKSLQLVAAKTTRPTARPATTFSTVVVPASPTAHA